MRVRLFSRDLSAKQICETLSTLPWSRCAQRTASNASGDHLWQTLAAHGSALPWTKTWSAGAQTLVQCLPLSITRTNYSGHSRESATGVISSENQFLHGWRSLLHQHDRWRAESGDEGINAMLRTTCWKVPRKKGRHYGSGQHRSSAASWPCCPK